MTNFQLSIVEAWNSWAILNIQGREAFGKEEADEEEDAVRCKKMKRSTST